MIKLSCFKKSPKYLNIIMTQLLSKDNIKTYLLLRTFTPLFWQLFLNEDRKSLENQGFFCFSKHLGAIPKDRCSIVHFFLKSYFPLAI